MNKTMIVMIAFLLLSFIRPSAPIIPVTAVYTPVAELKPGTYTVAFEYVATEMVTFWHSTSPGFLWVGTDKFTWTPGGFTMTVKEPVMLYVEGFGCANVCGKIRGLSVTAVP